MDIVFDSSTLILLAKIGLLRQISEEIRIIIPKKVKKECLIKHGMDSKLISTLIAEKKIEVVTVDSRAEIRRIQSDFRIEEGEAEAFYLARLRKQPLAVDDGPTIKVCKILGQDFLTAIHFLLDAASRNKLSKPIALEKFEKLTIYGRYSKRIIEDAMNRLKGGL